MTKAQKAYEMGKKDFKEGKTRNPFNYMPAGREDLAGWWQKGWRGMRDINPVKQESNNG